MKKETSKSYCVQCQNFFRGNDNKKFCTDRCKSAYHNACRKEETQEIGQTITLLKANRRIIRQLLAGEDTVKVSKDFLLDKGFALHYFTNTITKQSDKKKYMFCFEYGYAKETNGWCTIVRKSFVISPLLDLQPR